MGPPTPVDEADDPRPPPAAVTAEGLEAESGGDGERRLRGDSGGASICGKDEVRAVSVVGGTST
jgi:hypothetical protein